MPSPLAVATLLRFIRHPLPSGDCSRDVHHVRDDARRRRSTSGYPSVMKSVAVGRVAAPYRPILPWAFLLHVDGVALFRTGTRHWSLSRIHARASRRSLDSEPHPASTNSPAISDLLTSPGPPWLPLVCPSRCSGARNLPEGHRDHRDASNRLEVAASVRLIPLSWSPSARAGSPEPIRVHPPRRSRVPHRSHRFRSVIWIVDPQPSRVTVVVP